MTTTPAARDERKLFEAAYLKEYFYPAQRWSLVPEKYRTQHADIAWRAWQARSALAESELAEVREQVADARRTGQYWKDEHAAANIVIDELRAELERVKKFRDEWEKTCLDTKQRFKKFHSSLCDRFSYTHDDKYWWRDLISLEEHIAKAAIDAARGVEG